MPDSTTSPSSYPPFLDEHLDPQQLEAAACHLDKPLLILAGAGSGKTRTLTYRLAHLICGGYAMSENILAVTFTNKAAGELKERIQHILKSLGMLSTSKPWMGTFHSICVKLLREFYDSNFLIYDSGDQLALIKRILKQLKLQEKHFPPKRLREKFSQAKQAGLLPQDLDQDNSLIQMDLESLQVFHIYEQEKEQANALDFTDLLLKTVNLLKKSSEVRDTLSKRFQYIFVDEYQDTNALQYQLIRLLTQKHHNVCVVGDEDQSIYSWRGAQIKNILNFTKDFPEAKVIKLERNYRSTKNIVTAANSLIQNNSYRTPKTLFTDNISGQKIDVMPAPTEYDEGHYVAQEIMKLQNINPRLKLSQVGILYRAHSQSRILEEKLNQYKIPYIIVGSARFFDRKEIKDVLAYLKLIENPEDSVSLMRIINVPSRKIGLATLTKVTEWASFKGVSMMEALQKSSSFLPPAKSRQLSVFLSLYKRLVQFKAEATSLENLFSFVLEESGYLEMLKSETSTEALARIDNLQEFGNALKYFSSSHEEPTLKTFLAEVALVEGASDKNDLKDSVQLMTIHGAKGLEFEYVFIVGMEEGLFPSSRDDTDDMAMEEERRLAYVAITRAQKKLHISFCKSRHLYGKLQQPEESRFLHELPENLLNLKMPHSLSNKPHSYSYTSPSKSGTSKSSDSSYTYVYDEPDEELQALIGQKVNHEYFGKGRIKGVDSSGGLTKYQIYFENGGMKKIAASHVKMTNSLK